MPDQTPAETLRAACRQLIAHADNGTEMTLSPAAVDELSNWLASLCGIETVPTVSENGQLALEYGHALAVARTLLGAPS